MSSQWTTRFENHAVHAALENVATLLEKASESAREDPAALDSISRIEQIHGMAARAITTVDPYLASIPNLNNVNSYLSSQATELTNYASTKNTTHLNNANTQADNILAQLPALSPIMTPSDIEGVRESVSSFRMSAGQHLRYLEAEVSTLRSKLQKLTQKADGVSAEVQAQKGRVDAAISEFQQQFLSAESTRTESFAQSEKSRADKFAEASEARVTTSESLKSSLQSDISKFKSRWESQSGKLLKDHQREFDSLRDKMDSTAQGLIESIEATKEQAEKVAGIIANTGMVGGYQQIANQERTSARIFQGLALLSMAGLVVFAIWAFTGAVAEGFDLGRFGAKVFAAVSFGVLAAYAARQADIHQTSERHNRKMELELASVGPFLAQLPDETQYEVKKALAERMFGNSVPVKSNGPKTSGTSADLLKLALETVSELAKKS